MVPKPKRKPVSFQIIPHPSIGIWRKTICRTIKITGQIHKFTYAKTVSQKRVALSKRQNEFASYERL